VVSPGAISGTVGVAITPFQIIATNAPTSFSIVTPPGLPAGLVLDPDTGIITGTLAAPFSGTRQMRASNADGQSQPATLTITAAAPGTAPIVTAGSITATVGTAISTYTISTTGAPFVAPFFAITPALPAGLVLNATASGGTITGTPTAAQVATTYTITATNAFGSSTGTNNLTITINAGVTPGPGSAVIHISPAASPPPTPEPGQLWVQDNTNFIRYWLVPPGIWSPVVAGS